MKLALTARIRKLFDRYAVRITIGVVFSLLVHTLFLSLQLGLPGLGLPGLGMPWAERRAITPELSIRITNVAGSSPTQQQESPPPISSDTPPKPQEAVAASDQSLTELPSAHVKQAPARIAPVDPRSAKALKSSPAIAAVTKKNGTPPPDDQSAPAPARSEPELITLSGNRPDTFSVPAPDRDSWWRSAPKVDSIPLPIQPLEETAPPTIGLQSPKQTIDRSQEPAPALQKPSELESFERPDEMKAKEPEPSKTQDVAAELAEHKEGEEIAAQDAARKSAEQEAAQRAQDEQTRKQEEAHKEEEAAREVAAKKLFEEQAVQREQQAAEKRLADEKRKEQEEAERQAKEIAAEAARNQAEETARQQAAALALQKQREAAQLEEIKKQEQEKAKQQALEVAARQQAEEIARQKALELQKQKQEEQIAALKKAQEQAALRKAEAEAAAVAAAQRENARVAAIAAAAASASQAGNASNSADGNSGTASAGKSGNQSHAAGAGDLASNALAQISKIDLTRIAPAPPNDADHQEEATRRGSFLGRPYEADVVVDAYIRDWRNKIESGGSMNYSQSSKNLARENPVVTVAIRSDGSVEDIIINRSSGRIELDEAVKRIVHFYAPYGKFPANLARKFSIIEIRRIWSFDETLRLLEEVH